MKLSELEMAREILVRLSTAEVIVISNALSRLESELDCTEALGPAEQRAFSNLGAVLEKNNPIVFAADYGQHVDAAQAFLLEGRQP